MTYMTYQEALNQIKQDLIKKNKDFPRDTKLYIGKSSDEKLTVQRHEIDEHLYYVTFIANGSPLSISNLERDLITHFSESNKITLLNEVKGSPGNPNANKLYICFDSPVENDEFGEWDFKLGEYYPISVD